MAQLAGLYSCLQKQARTGKNRQEQAPTQNTVNDSCKRFAQSCLRASQYSVRMEQINRQSEVKCSCASSSQFEGNTDVESKPKFEEVFQITSPQQLQDIMQDPNNQDTIIVLMCKARTCRPCKAFKAKYKRLAIKFPEALMLEVYGDSTNELRSMMVKMEVKVTPTFRLYRGSTFLAAQTGANRETILGFIAEHYRGKVLLSMDEDEGNYQQSKSSAAPA